MKRRSFLAALFAAPAAAKAAAPIDMPDFDRHANTEHALTASSANIGTHVVGPYKSPNGRMLIDFSTGTITITD